MSTDPAPDPALIAEADQNLAYANTGLDQNVHQARQWLAASGGDTLTTAAHMLHVLARAASTETDQKLLRRQYVAALIRLARIDNHTDQSFVDPA